MSGNLRSFARVVNSTISRLHGKRTVASSDWEDSWHYPLQSVDVLDYFCVAYIIYGCPELPSSIASLDDLRNDISDRGGDIEIDLLPGTSGAVEIRLNAPGGFDSNDDDFYGLTADNFIFYTKRISGNMGDRFNNEINGGSGDDAIYGEQGRDILNGGGGDDEIYGGENEDTINGGEGDDWLDGGPGDDTFVFEPGNGNDHIMDFTSGDMIDLSAFTDAGGNPLDISDIPDETTGDDNYVIDLSEFGGGTITVLDVTTLGGDFIFTA